MTRRYGRVTFEGWLLDVAGDTYLNTMREGFNASETGVLYSGLQPTVEYLPEPVVFKVGDAALKTFDKHPSVVWVRLDDDRWGALGYGPNRITDDSVRQGIADGSMVRLIPEVTS